MYKTWSIVDGIWSLPITLDSSCSGPVAGRYLPLGNLYRLWLDPLRERPELEFLLLFPDVDRGRSYNASLRIACCYYTVVFSWSYLTHNFSSNEWSCFVSSSSWVCMLVIKASLASFSGEDTPDRYGRIEFGSGELVLLLAALNLLYLRLELAVSGGT